MKLDLSKKATLKEYIILWLLIFFAAYYFGVWQPTENKLDTITIAQQQVDMDTQVATAKLMLQNNMQSWLDEQPEGEAAAEIPCYGSTNSACARLEEILSRAESFRYELSEEQRDEHIVRRTADIDFQAIGYDTVTGILNDIQNSENCYLINTLTIVKGSVSAAEGTESYSVTLQLTYFEYLADITE